MKWSLVAKKKSVWQKCIRDDTWFISRATAKQPVQIPTTILLIDGREEGEREKKNAKQIRNDVT